MSGLVPETFATLDLRASRPSWDDLDDLARMFTIPTVMRTLSVDGKARSRNQTIAALGKTLHHWTRHGFGVWVFRDPQGRFVGYCGLKHALVEGADEVEILYALVPAFWKKGLATEMARASLVHGRAAVPPAGLVGFTLPWNRPSRNVLERCGFAYERPITHAGLPHVLYRLS